MKIKDSRDKSLIKYFEVFNKKAYLAIFLVIFILGGYANKQNFFSRFPTFIINTVIHPFNSIYANLEKVDKLYINISFDKARKMSNLRNKALERNTLRGLNNKYIKATMRINSDSALKIKLRLKGGIAKDHLSGDKWSYRVKMSGRNRAYGMKSFSLMDPQRRGFMHTWLLRSAMKSEGIISKRYKFIELVINGTSKGIYAMDEHFDTVMLENNERKESAIIRFIQEPLFYEKAAWNSIPSANDNYYYSLNIGKFADFEDKDNILEAATLLLDGFRRGQLETSQVFNTDLLSKWLAISDVLGAWHGFSFNNMRFYYNPIDGKLEPIPDDHYNEKQGRIDSGRVFRLNDSYNKGAFLKNLFSDMSFTELYLKELRRVTQRKYIDDLWNTLENEINSNIRILRKDYPYYGLDQDGEMNSRLDEYIKADRAGKREFYYNQERLSDILDVYQGVTANFKKHDDLLWIDVATLNNIPIEILGILIGDGSLLHPEGKDRVVLKGKDFLKLPKYISISFTANDKTEFYKALKSNQAKILYKVLGSDKEKFVTIGRQPIFKKITKVEPNIEMIEGLDFVEIEQGIIKISSGKHIIKSDFLVPKGFELHVGANTELNLINEAAILSYSPVIMVGSDNKPIIISSSDGTGEGIAVINADKKSILSNVVFDNLSKIKKRWIEGASAPVIFYKSPVYIEKTEFLSNISGDDYLNIIHSNYFIKNTLFNDTVSDAFDSDFATGKVIDTVFNNIGVREGKNNTGGDAIDLSGSYAFIEDVSINNVSDKGISVGENSRSNIRNVDIKKANIAIAVKDSSSVDSSNLLIENSNIGFVVFRKKKEFSGGSLTVDGVKFISTNKEYLLEKLSKLVINNIDYKPNSKKIRNRLYQ